ncbi:MAG: efflux RND transporter periplasmic adaptor subunit [Planctomycetota bacterium]
MLRQFTVRVPEPPRGSDQQGESVASASKGLEGDSEDVVYTVEKIDVFPGKLVQPGDELCDLAFHTVLNIEGQAFEREADLISQATTHQWPIQAVFESSTEAPFVREGLKILYVDNVVDKENRTFRFHIPLLNEVVRDNKSPSGAVYRSWKFKPGQKVRLLVPVEEWKDRMVLPVDALVKEGPDAYVFRANGAKLERVGVHVEYQDSKSVVLADDGSLFPGDEIAANRAYQINLALKQAAGTGIDPHAGHNH